MLPKRTPSPRDLQKTNTKSIISSHNKAVLSDYHRSQTETNNKKCNCRKKDQCPLDGKCLIQNGVYQATVTTQTSSESYVGLATNFKDRYRNHTASFRHERRRNETELSKHIWNLCSLNKRNELAGSYPHRNRFLLKNFVIK